MRSVVDRVLLIVVGLVAIAALAGVALLWPSHRAPRPAYADQTTDLVDAVLLEVLAIPSPDPQVLLPGAKDVLVTARIEDSGEVVTFDMTDETGDSLSAGQKVRLAVTETPEQPTIYYVNDFRRAGPMTLLLGLFLCVVVAFGRLQGVRALLGLAASFVVIIGFMVPAILADRPPVAVAVVGSLLIMVTTLYLSHGWSVKTTAAVVGTAAALLLTAALAAAFVSASQITGMASEDARLANLSVGGLSLRGLLLAGVIIGGLGVLDDVTMSQASTVFALRRANPKAGFSELVREALSVGRDHIAATVNTLFLAYAGASLPLLLLFSTGIDPAGIIVTSETVAVEVIRALVGSIGLIAAVPLTTAMAAAVALGDRSGSESDAAPPARRRPPARQDDWEERLRDAYGLR
ncbi:MAG: YibE/F family protein [Egibacteraceae bacterium]